MSFKYKNREKTNTKFTEQIKENRKIGERILFFQISF